MIRRIGDAENPYIVRVSEEDYAGPRSIFPTAGRLIGDAENPYAVPPEARDAEQRLIGGDPIMSGSIEDRRLEEPENPLTGFVKTAKGRIFGDPQAMSSPVGNEPPGLEIPDEKTMKKLLRKQRDSENSEFLTGDRAYFKERMDRELRK